MGKNKEKGKSETENGTEKDEMERGKSKTESVKGKKKGGKDK